ncbi:MAG: hypothetical protein AUF76_04610 [Acidobacteria bacterium 13_1_20CM_2_65_9]|nr:MAG: hypothetical protein AUF76_04610 [Acidobacteria bacterium 13_1_20CM_2_65_9]
MIFLIEYDRKRGRIVTFKRFPDTDRSTAEKDRLDLELNRNGQEVRTEIVLLEAATEDALRQTHRRYFQNAREIIESST